MVVWGYELIPCSCLHRAVCFEITLFFSHLISPTRLLISVKKVHLVEEVKDKVSYCAMLWLSIFNLHVFQCVMCVYVLTCVVFCLSLMLTVEHQYCSLKFCCIDTRKVKGWRKELFRLCSDSFGYYENPSTSISYEGVNLICHVWFEKVEYMRSFYENVRKGHECFCEGACCPRLEFGDIDFSLKRAPYSLSPVLSGAYIANDSESPEQSEAGYRSILSGVSFASASTPDVYFRLVEQQHVFEEIKPCGCHIADAAMYKEFDGDMDNRLYFSQDLHSMFDGRQTTDSLPHVGVYFVSFDGRETVEYGGQELLYDRVTIGFETPYQGTRHKISFKEGSSLVEGSMHTCVHVRSHEKFKHFLDLKYSKTSNAWDSRNISFKHKIDVDVNAICTDLASMSVTDAASKKTKTFECSQCKKVCKSERGLNSHVGSKKCLSSQLKKDI